MQTVSKSKPRLYLDIDGVIYGWYGGQWQIRPYTVTLIEWAKKYFNVKWLSFNGRNELIGKVLYTELPKTDMGPTIGIGKGKWEKLRGIEEDGNLDDDWFIIEDTPPTLEAWEILHKKNILHKWILVPESGSDVLLEVKYVLENWLETKKIQTPEYWQKANFLDKSLCLTNRYLGPRKEQCEPQ